MIGMLAPGGIRAEGRCPAGMVRVSGGTYTVGADTWWRKWAVARKTAEVKAFCIDRYEYPNAWGETPLVNIPFMKARELCVKGGKRLCRQEEWLAACQGKEGRLYSYGVKKDIRKCNTDGHLLRGAQEILPSGVFSECASPDGVHDLDGNVSEFVESDDIPGENILLGGTAWWSDWYGQDCTSRHSHPDDFQGLPDDGFRCCK